MAANIYRVYERKYRVMARRSEKIGNNFKCVWVEIFAAHTMDELLSRVSERVNGNCHLAGKKEKMFKSLNGKVKTWD